MLEKATVLSAELLMIRGKYQEGLESLEIMFTAVISSVKERRYARQLRIRL